MPTTADAARAGILVASEPAAEEGIKQRVYLVAHLQPCAIASPEPDGNRAPKAFSPRRARPRSGGSRQDSETVRQRPGTPTSGGTLIGYTASPDEDLDAIFNQAVAEQFKGRPLRTKPPARRVCHRLSRRSEDGPKPSYRADDEAVPPATKSSSIVASLSPNVRNVPDSALNIGSISGAVEKPKRVPMKAFAGRPYAEAPEHAARPPPSPLTIRSPVL